MEIQEKDKNLQIIKESLKIQAELNIKITSEMNGIEKEIDRVAFLLFNNVRKMRTAQ